MAQHQREQLHRAAAAGDLDRVKSLLAAKYSINRFDELSRTPLHYAASGEHMEVVELLLKSGADVNAYDAAAIGETALGGCAASCSYAMAKRLIDAGADPTIPGWMMLTALHQTKDRKRPEGERVYRLLKDTAERRPR